LTETTRALTENCAQFVHKPPECDGDLNQLIGSRLLDCWRRAVAYSPILAHRRKTEDRWLEKKRRTPLKKSLAAEDYNIKVGPVRFQTEGRLALGYTDNVFFSGSNKRNDFLINPEVDVRALWPITELKYITVLARAGI